RAERLRPRHFASRIEGPIAIEPDDTPFHAPGHPDPTGIFADRVVDGMLEPVIDQRHGGAETPGNRVRRTGPVGALMDFSKANDAKFRVPENTLLFGKARADLVECRWMVAGGNIPVIFR